MKLVRHDPDNELPTAHYGSCLSCALANVIRIRQLLLGLFLVLSSNFLHAGITKGYYDWSGGGWTNLNAIHASAAEACTIAIAGCISSNYCAVGSVFRSAEDRSPPGTRQSVCYALAPNGTVYWAVSLPWYFSCNGGVTWSPGEPSCSCDKPLVWDSTRAICVSPNPKSLGTSCTVPGGVSTLKPINIGTGNKFLAEADYRGAGTFPLEFVRQYNSMVDATRGISGAAGARWRTHSWLSNIVSTSSVTVNRPDQKAYVYTLTNSQWVTDADVSERLARLVNASYLTSGWEITARDGTVERYDPSGRLLHYRYPSGLTRVFSNINSNQATIADAVGRTLTLNYNAQYNLSTLTDPSGNVTSYAYDANANLISVTYPDGSVKQYHYENATFKNALTGITDERGVRYITYTYDAEGKAVGEVMAGGVESYGLAFGANQTTVTDPLGTSRTYNFQTILGVVKNTGVSQPGGSGCGPAAEAIIYDANGNVASKTDFNGKKTTYAYDLARNLETSRTEGLSGSGAALPETRTITTSWHPTWRLPVTVNEYAGAAATGNPVRRTQTAYDDRGNVVSRSVTDVAAGATRTWTTSYTYSAAVPGLILQKVEDGPRTDVTDTVTTDYYPHDEACAGAALGTGRDKGCRGQVKRTTNALGQVTQFTRYNAHGQAEEITDPNGVTTTLAYDLRQRLTSRATAGETTSYQYDGVGQLTRLTLPDGSTINYTYDGARRLTAVADSLGNSIAYTLDAAGNRTREDIRDPQGTLVKTLSRAYDALGRLQTLTGVGNE